MNENLTNGINPNDEAALEAAFSIQGDSCATYENLPPVYLSVRREVFLHVGIGNPSDPYDYDAIAEKVIVGANDVVPPFVRVIPTNYPITYPIYICGSSEPPVTGFAHVTALRVIAAGNFAPVVYSPSINRIFTGMQDNIALDQIIDYIGPEEPIPLSSEFDIDVDLQNGPIPADSSDPQYIGFTDIAFYLDDPTGDSNGPGTYFFVVHPYAKIKYIVEPS